MAKDKKLIQAEKASEASDKELENVSGGTEITDNESININNNIFDTSIKFDNFDFGANINFNNSNDTDTKQNIINKNITSSNNSDIKIF